LGGGLPAQRLHLIEGHPGTGKTTLTDFHGVMTGVPQYVGTSGPLLHKKDGQTGR
jgi:KaiC/GvpD/RAD55 family RecA-like ATPase